MTIDLLDTVPLMREQIRENATAWLETKHKAFMEEVGVSSTVHVLTFKDSGEYYAEVVVSVGYPGKQKCFYHLISSNKADSRIEAMYDLLERTEEKTNHLNVAKDSFSNWGRRFPLQVEMDVDGG